MTTGGRGVAFFAPFCDERYFLPWRFIHVSPLGASNFFSTWGLRVIKNEFWYVGIPCLILIGIGIFMNKTIYPEQKESN
jgi:inner membrane protein